MHSLGQKSGGLAWLLFALMSTNLLAASSTPFPPPKPANPLFKDRPFGPLPPPTPTPETKRVPTEEEQKPIPVEWKIAGLVALGLAVLAILYLSARAWRSSAIFEQSYRFPRNDDAALRFGGTRCGGHMATIEIGPVPMPQKKSATLPRRQSASV
jgi:hypothetical protein